MGINDSSVHVALASNDRYFDGLLVAVASIARYADKSRSVVFHILDEDISEDHFLSLCDCVSREHYNSVVDRIHVTRGDLPNLPEFHGSWLPYARLMLPSLLPSVDRVVYCDVDFLWLADICELWDLCQDEYVLHSTRDGFGPTEDAERRWFKSHGLEFPEGRYFCSGLCVFNLLKFREERLADQIIAFVESHKDAGFPDQAALNALLNSRTKLLDKRWQQTPRIMKPGDFKLPFVLHYAGEAPWKATHTTCMVTDSQLLWYEVFASIHGLTLWKALRQHYSASKIIICRAIFLIIMVCPLTAFAFNQFMKLNNRGPFRERTRLHL